LLATTYTSMFVGCAAIPQSLNSHPDSIPKRALMWRNFFAFDNLRWKLLKYWLSCFRMSARHLLHRKESNFFFDQCHFSVARRLFSKSLLWLLHGTSTATSIASGIHLISCRSCGS